MYRSTTPNRDPKSSFLAPVRLTLAGLVGSVLISSSAVADYQQALAARATIAPEPATAPIEIEQQYVRNAFLLDAEEGNKAISDKEVMVELVARMSDENHLEQAAANLAPKVSEIVDANPKVNTEPESAGTVAAR